MNSKELFVQAFPEDLSIGRNLPDFLIAGLECDSRIVGKDFIFVAVRGVKQDGAFFSAEAAARGARVIVTESATLKTGNENVHVVRVNDSRLAVARLAAAYFGHPSRTIKAVGLTGTNGKTTSAYLLEHLLISERKKTGVIGTINIRYDGNEIPAQETTPGPPRIQNILSDMVRASCEYVVMEVSSHALDQKRTEGISFASALFTNLTEDHLDHHGTLEKYFECKAKLFLALESKSFSVLNAEDAWNMRLNDRLTSKILTYGVRNFTDLRAENIRFEGALTRFDLVRREKILKGVSPLVGLHNVYNVLGALAVMESLGFDPENSLKNLPTFPGVPGRLERVDLGQDFRVFIDFAHTPDGLENVLGSLVPYKSGKLILVFGCGGERDRGKRPKMAGIASRFCEQVYVTSDNPRSEDPREIAREICAGFPENFRCFAVVPDRHKAVRQALMAARKGDIVLLAGKGHERTQVLSDCVVPFSDREEAEKILSGR